ncbi:hypothetical protein [Streptomyces sp. V4I2]|uniref:hypothetical protein n=1 Tax=Streptomyces sp. V4I2 TaxID=3042280 RepID=UPI00278A6B91|nr:hypothetical protein [Streptomyces sp. V4I2]MDQ1042552.1 hypothetical protein [Streptomyces sp. V4I2]
MTAGDPWDELECEMYPPALKYPYKKRRSAFGEQRYGALGTTCEDWEARLRAAAANCECFGATAALFCCIDRSLGPAQWSDVGMYLQTVMLLLRAEGLHNCAQTAWSVCRKTVAEVAPGRAHPLLRHVDRVRGRHDGSRAYESGAARGDCHVRRGEFVADRIMAPLTGIGIARPPLWLPLCGDGRPATPACDGHFVILD